MSCAEVCKATSEGLRPPIGATGAATTMFACARHRWTPWMRGTSRRRNDTPETAQGAWAWRISRGIVARYAAAKEARPRPALGPFRRCATGDRAIPAPRCAKAPDCALWLRCRGPETRKPRAGRGDQLALRRWSPGGNRPPVPSCVKGREPPDQRLPRLRCRPTRSGLAP